MNSLPLDLPLFDKQKMLLFVLCFTERQKEIDKVREREREGGISAEIELVSVSVCSAAIAIARTRFVVVAPNEPSERSVDSCLISVKP